jgi:exopolyphosphatase / guanosine-5'-triphosphate,3'-diphosphate pyrophosphatase
VNIAFTSLEKPIILFLSSLFQTWKAAVIDLGFNSAKLVNYHVNRNNNSFKAYEQEGAKIRLGQDLRQSGILGREPTRRAIHTLKLFRDIINFQCIKCVLAIATSAVRAANNQDDFLHEVFQALIETKLL